ncbi:MAG: transferrin-binding protein-like solute binding protein [Paracoccus sp. (in: a-proteobacteria)]|uniref:transferrin-binding protein-like solute binding protein n=1 Tax=Paracoccus sp. TaxID=267 RepID=UPI0026E0B1E1|nr:transferrin-binding protein-like solute binding protein [Paracoccus sp. (in: a-proteobacteria)]MDO5612870.1 transferrin-binding protein-like solute binding protein [Paracoccus sp. (in: a-proteobacteria)]
MACLFVAACGGGGGSSVTPVDPVAPSFNALMAESRAFYGTYAGDGKLSDNLTPQMPVAGNFNYQGTALLWTGDKINNTSLDTPDMDTVVAAGRLSATADIAGNSITGQITDFKSATGQPMVSGSVGVGGTISDNSYIGTPTGQLNIGINRYNVTGGSVIGHFVGDYARGTAGIVAGNLNEGAETFMMTYTGER